MAGGWRLGPAQALCRGDGSGPRQQPGEQPSEPGGSAYSAGWLIFFALHSRNNGLPVPVGLPGRGDDVGHVGAVQQRGPGQGELPVAVVDIVHDLVQAVEAAFLVSEQFRLALLRSRVERSHLYLEHAFPAPVLVHDPVA